MVRRQGPALVFVGRFLPGLGSRSTCRAAPATWPSRGSCSSTRSGRSLWSTQAALLGYFAGKAFADQLWLALLIALGVAALVGGLVALKAARAGAAGARRGQAGRARASGGRRRAGRARPRSAAARRSRTRCARRGRRRAPRRPRTTSSRLTPAAKLGCLSFLRTERGSSAGEALRAARGRRRARSPRARRRRRGGARARVSRGTSEVVGVAQDGPPEPVRVAGRASTGSPSCGCWSRVGWRS